MRAGALVLGTFNPLSDGWERAVVQVVLICFPVHVKKRVARNRTESERGLK